jgi:glutathione peroxidase
MRVLVGLVAGMLLLAPVLVGAEDKKKGDKKVAPALNFKMKGIDGKEVDLSKYQGKVVLIVNVASKCGNTPQYKGLQELYEKYGKDGFVILGVPANNFGKQEPGTNEEIAEFCSSKYHVTFPMLAKVSVKGEDKCPLYQFLTSKETNPKFGDEIPWNFEKFLIGRNGEVVQRFNHRVKPETEKVVKAIEAELKKK